jgi:hypothetical protein
MAGKHGGARPGAGRKRKQPPAKQQPAARSDRTNLKATLLEQQHKRAIARGRRETAARIRARLEFLREFAVGVSSSVG